MVMIIRTISRFSARQPVSIALLHPGTAPLDYTWILVVYSVENFASRCGLKEKKDLNLNLIY